MNIRAIHVRLILWYSGLVALVCIAFGAFIYKSVEAKFYRELQHVLTRRANLLASTLLEHTEINQIAGRIHVVYFPEASNRFIRILNEDRSVVYSSGEPKDRQFTPDAIPLTQPDTISPYFVPIPHDERLMVVPVSVTAGGRHYLIEMGALVNDIETALDGLIRTLLFGLPTVMLVVSAGGYFLIRRALQPVEDIRATAERITFGNLSRRLPVAITGDAIENLSITLNQMLDRLEAAYEQASRFSADASHELRTPLTIMRGELEAMLREQAAAAPLQERVASVLEEAERLSRITENLFAISRLDAGEAKAQHTRFDLSALARNTAEQMALLADEKHIALAIQTAEPVTVEGDPARMKQVVVNLLDNAVKYTPEGGKVTLSVHAASHKAIIEVEDSGVGIPAEALPHVFERFYRADKARSRDMGGAGLGLAIVRSICQAHGGMVDIQSREGEGTLCRVELPLAAQENAS